MVNILIKHENESFYLYNTQVSVKICELVKELVILYNSIMKVNEICAEIEGLAKYGVSTLPAEDLKNRICGLHLTNESTDNFMPKGGHVTCSDPFNRRCGCAPNEEMANVLYKVLQEARSRVSKNQVDSGVCLNVASIQETFESLTSSVSIVYPKGLPVYDPLHKDLKKIEVDPKSFVADLCTKVFFQFDEAELWWAGKKLHPDKHLSDYIGTNDKTKITAKLQKRGQGPPVREPSLTQEEVQQVMLLQYKRQQELRKLEEDEDHSYLDSEWADNHYLKKSFQDLNNIRWK